MGTFRRLRPAIVPLGAALVAALAFLGGALAQGGSEHGPCGRPSCAGDAGTAADDCGPRPCVGDGQSAADGRDGTESPFLPGSTSLALGGLGALAMIGLAIRRRS